MKHTIFSVFLFTFREDMGMTKGKKKNLQNYTLHKANSLRQAKKIEE